MSELVEIEEIYAARERLHGAVRQTPLIEAPQRWGISNLWLKPEQFQPVASFKLRGAYNRLAALDAKSRAAGVVAYSSGNHAQGVAWAAAQLGIAATIVMPANAPAIKIKATRAWGAEVRLYDPLTESREQVAADLLLARGGTLAKHTWSQNQLGLSPLQPSDAFLSAWRCQRQCSC